MTFHLERICEYELKHHCNCFLLSDRSIQLAGLIEEHLDLGPTKRIGSLIDRFKKALTFTSPV